ncbi:biotin synthase [Protomyces lactucae-debilis]|uniref:biotin synthase n=1 Tax=Protomyces lactucae-debilis TaxID=2754530 RepID=A0A1Y2FYE8_PROLT|nr:biotin synthase [Protomyces lactucae-debilis]ORY87705.1 biotin synthase [Protomyces lactucae-debilis]
MIRTRAANSPLPASQQPSDFTKDDIRNTYRKPLLDLIHEASSVHRANQDPHAIQLCTLLNIKSGGCSEDCSYCSQSSRYKTTSPVTKLMTVDDVLVKAREAKENGSTRFCMGSAWRDMNGRKANLKRICEMVTEIRGMGMEVCTTLGMLNEAQAIQLKEAGLTAYNHNIDTSREFYPSVITTRSFDERLATIDNVKSAGIKVCSGGILGLGEKEEDRISFLHTLSGLRPESLPINALVPIEGTPLYSQVTKPLPIQDILRTIATARILLPKTIIRLAAGRISLAETDQAMCFLAGANAVFTGERMLTTACSGWEEDKAMLDRWGLRGMKSFEKAEEQPAQQQEQPILFKDAETVKSASTAQ